MVLDTVHKIVDNLSPGYEVGDFKLIFKNTYDDEENGEPRQFILNAKDANAPDFFYYVHIEVDLNSVQDCTCSDSRCQCR